MGGEYCGVSDFRIEESVEFESVGRKEYDDCVRASEALLTMLESPVTAKAPSLDEGSAAAANFGALSSCSALDCCCTGS